MGNLARLVTTIAAAFFALVAVAVSPAQADVDGAGLANQRPDFPYNFCATPEGNSTANGTVVTLWKCNNNDLMLWRWRGDNLVHSVSGKCLTPRGNSYNNGTVLTLWTCTGSPVQDFQGTHGTRETIRTMHSDKCLTNYGGDVGNGVWVTLWTCDPKVPLEQWWGWAG